MFLGSFVPATAGRPAGVRIQLAADSVPTRVSAVLQTYGKCLPLSHRKVKISSAAQKILDPAQAWQLSQGHGVTVAVLDTGMNQAGAGQLAGQVTVGPDEVPGGRAGTDCVGHGTFVAGLIAARPRSGTTVVGIAPQAHVFAITVTDDQGATSPDILAKGIGAAVGAGARIIDVSVVSSRSSPALVRAVRAAIGRGAMVLTPAVADDQDLSGPVYPAALPGVVTVADAPSQSSDTGTGSGTATARPATLEAPGDAVLSLGPGGGAFIGSGAAYATALVAGTAALVDAYHPGLTLAQRIHRLTATAYPVLGSAGTDSGAASSGLSGDSAGAGAAGASPAAGGMIDPYAAVSEILPDEYRAASGTGPVAAALPAVPAPEPPGTALHTGLLLAAAGLGAVLVGLGGLATARRGRRRGWRPGGPGSVPEIGDQ